jgi:type IV pilus assembly protein PilN
MARINLLPWRAELRKQRRNEFLAIVGGFAAFTLLVCALVHFHFDGRIEFQQERNAFIQTEIGKLDKKIRQIQDLEREKDRLIARMKAIETLQSSRPAIVHIFDELVAALPEGVYLREVIQNGDLLTLKGVAESNARVSSLMRKIKRSEWLKDPKLEIIQAADESGRRIANFTLRMTQTAPKAATGADEDAT